MIGCIFVEKCPLKSPYSDLKWILAPMRAFTKEAPTIFRKHMPWGIGRESLGMIACILAENEPLEGGIESSLNGTVHGAKGDFIRFSYLYPYIFESRTPTFFESTCLELYTQPIWEWSDSYSWRNDFWKMDFKRACKKPTGVLTVIWSGFLAPMCAFSKGTPSICSRMFGCIFTESGSLEAGIEARFSSNGWGVKDEFR